MGVLYTEAEMEAALRELRIRPTDENLVNVGEAARILTWRAKSEQNMDRQYTTAAIRAHIVQGNLSVAKQLNPRSNLFRVGDIFNLPLSPRRGLVNREIVEDATQPPPYDAKSLHRTGSPVLESVC